MSASIQKHPWTCCRAFVVGLLLCLLPVAATIAQGIYEVKYTFNNHPGIEYTALIFYYSDNPDNNTMRIRYYNNNGWNIAEQKVQPVFFSQGGKDYWVLDGKNSSIIAGPEKGLEYTPDEIFMAKKAGATYYEPSFSASPHADGKSEYGKITSFKALTRSDVTNDYLSAYNWKWPETDQTAAVGTLHLILVSNTNDPNLGSGFYANHRKLASLFRDIQQACNLNLDIIELTGSDFSKSTVASRISNLSVNSNDVIFFYYSGHGYNDRQSEWPHLDMRQGMYQPLGDNSLSLADDIYSPLIGKKARLTIVIGECCNRYADNAVVTGTPVKEDPIMMAPSQNMLNASTLVSLLNRSGRMLVRSSDINEPSYYTLNYGGDFCNNFISSLLNETGFTNTHGDVRWKDIFYSSFTSTLSDSPKESSQQHVKYYYGITED